MPAFEVVAGDALVMIISSVLALHDPLLIVHLNVTLLPPVNPVKPLSAIPEDSIVALPLTTLHNPVPVVGVFAVTVAVLTLHTF